MSRTVSVSCCQDVLIICESESDLEFFADCEDSDIDDDDGISDNELTDAVSICNVYICLRFVLQHQRDYQDHVTQGQDHHHKCRDQYLTYQDQYQVPIPRSLSQCKYYWI